jgi:hypothetical protein
MSEIFISYSRKDRDFVETLQARLREIGREAWVDVEGVPPTAKWRAEILSSIEQANAFVFVLSPDSISSLECVREVAHAVKRNKRIIPIIYREVDPKSVPPDLAELNWISVRPLDAGFDTLLKAIDTDLDWVRGHTRLGVRALEWDARDREPSLLLHGADLRAAEQWLATAEGHEPAPTSAHTEYVRASRRARITRRRLLISSVASVVILLGAFGFVAYERGRPIRAALDTLTERVDAAKPNHQPIRTATAVIEMVLPSTEASHKKLLKTDVNVRDLGCPSLISLVRDTGTLLTLSTEDCFVRKEKTGHVVYWAVVNMDPAEAASEKPVAWLANADSVRVSIYTIPANSRISGGKAVLTVNNSVRFDIPIIPQVLAGDTASAPIPNSVRHDLSK